MIAVIGDVHGCFHSLKLLTGNIRKAYPDIDLFCVGDLIDRGNFSDLVIDFCQAEEISCVMGNHELMFLHAFSKPQGMYGTTWLYNQPIKTLTRYSKLKEKFILHREWISALPFFQITQNVLITHAGISEKISPEIKLFSNNSIAVCAELLHETYLQPDGCLWNRESIKNVGLLQVYGHTKRNEPKYIESANAYCVDTGAYLPNRLTAVLLEQGNFVDYISVKTQDADTA